MNNTDSQSVNGCSKILVTAKKLQETFIAVASNKFLNPIIAIKWNLEILLAAKNLDQHTVDKLEDIRRNIQKLDDITKLMVRIYEIATSAPSETYQVINFRNIANGIFDEFDLLIKQNSIQISNKLDENLDYDVRGSEVFAREMVRTVIENAIYYNNIGGRIEVKLRELDHSVVLDISDTGLGIPENEKDLIFSPFYRGSNVMKLSFRGNGLCLYFVKMGLDSIGGSISFDSNLGKGTTFHLVFPVKR